MKLNCSSYSGIFQVRIVEKGLLLVKDVSKTWASHLHMFPADDFPTGRQIKLDSPATVLSETTTCLMGNEGVLLRRECEKERRCSE